MKQSLQKYGKPVLLGLVIALVLTGIELEFGQLAGVENKAQLYPAYFMTAGLLGVYLFPFFWIIRYLQQRFTLPSSLLAGSWLVGLFVPGWLASIGNDLASGFWKVLIPSETVLKEWDAALTGPFVEEFLKGFAVLLVIGLFYRIMTLKSSLVVGMIVGMGFQITEDLSYLKIDIFQNEISGVPATLLRVATSLTSHWLYTAIIGVAIYLFIKNHQAISRKTALIWLCLPVLLHFLWNSPLTSTVNGATVLLGVASLLLFFHVYRTVDSLEG